MSETPDSEQSRLFRDRPLETFTCPQGAVEVWHPAPGIAVTRVVGLLTEGGAAAIEAAVRRQIVLDGHHVGFHDWEGMADYEPGARTRLTSFGVATLGTLDCAHFLLRSRVVAFGVQIANIVVKKLTVHATRADFERELKLALRRRNRESLAQVVIPSTQRSAVGAR